MNLTLYDIRGNELNTYKFSVAHIRNRSNGEMQQNGGGTVVAIVDPTGLKLCTAHCNPIDKFNKRTGILVALNNYVSLRGFRIISASVSPDSHYHIFVANKESINEANSILGPKLGKKVIRRFHKPNWLYHKSAFDIDILNSLFQYNINELYNLKESSTSKYSPDKLGPIHTKNVTRSIT